MCLFLISFGVEWFLKGVWSCIPNYTESMKDIDASWLKTIGGYQNPPLFF